MQSITKALAVFATVLCLAACASLPGPQTELSAAQPTVLITGANRGLGLEFARQYAAAGWNVIASCRNPAAASDLINLAKLHDRVRIEKLDVTSDKQVATLAKKYANQPIDVLLNNAGIYGNLESQTLGSLDFDELKKVLDVNSIGSLRVSVAFLDQVLASEQKKIISLGGGMGTQSIGRMFGGHYFMKMSKAAHLSAMGTLVADLKNTGAMIVMISPGRVDTQLMRDSGWTGKSTPASLAAAEVIGLIDRLEPDMNGRLIMFNGKTVPW
jgi:NAD(P)-dependent dehydrogenase (short-subunit alcohol dehydrogenase family)